MIAEVNFYGIYLSTLLATGILTCAIHLCVQRALTWIGFYQLVWHRRLFDFALFFILWGLTLKASSASGDPFAFFR